MNEVTFKDFARLMVKRKRGVNDLVDLFRSKIEDPRDFFERVMACQWRDPATRRFEDRGGVVIPYRSVIDFYLKEQAFLADSGKGRRQRKIGGLAA